jgi:predicted metal-dependent peptidase
MAVTQPSKVDPRVVRVSYPEVALTSQQNRMWGETLAAVNWIAPGFTHILYTMLNKRGDSQVALFTEALPEGCDAATDGVQLLFKPSDFFKWSLMERVFTVCHEIAHCISDHCGMGYQMKKRGAIHMGNKTLPYDPMFANVVQDLIINDMLIEAQFGSFNKAWLWDQSKATYKDDWVEVYFKLAKEASGGGGKGKGKGQGQGNQPGQHGGKGVTQPGNAPGQGQGQTPLAPGQFDQHLDPGATQGQQPEDAAPRDVQEWQQAVAGALAIARGQGKSPAAFEMFFGDILEPKVDWTEHLKTLIARKVGSGGYDFRRPDRRLIVRDIIAPGRTGHGAGLVIIGMDSSGSIYGDPKLIDRWMGELTGIMEDVRPKEVWVVWCDAKVQRVDELTDSSDIDTVRHKGAKGGGGTSFVPVFDYIEEKGVHPDCLLYLTDGDGTFPDEAPRYAVIWGDITKTPSKYPWGDVVEVPTGEDA